MKKNEIYKTQSFNPLFAFLLITTALLITVSICCYLIKYQTKLKHSLPYYVTKNKFLKKCINNIKMESNNELKGTDIKSLMCYYLMI